MVKYLEGAFKFLIKNYKLAIPLYVLFALSFLFEGDGLGKLTSALQSGSTPVGGIDMGAALAGAWSVLSAISGGFLATALYFIVDPVTYGLVNKSLDGQAADLQRDSVPLLRKNLIKYVFYFIGKFVVAAAVFIVFLIVLALFALITLVLKGLGVFLATIVFTALVAATVILFTLLSLWFPAMLLDDLSVKDAAKKSVELVKPSFWTILAFTLIVVIAASAVRGILFFLSYIPLLGSLLLAAIPAAQAFIMATFYLTVYREKTGRLSRDF